MRVQKLARDSEYLENVRLLVDEAFPADERVSIDEMFGFPIDTDVLAFFDGEAFVGFAFALAGKRSVYVSLLAMEKDCRGQGYGSEALRLIREYYRGRQVTLDFENVVEGAPNYAQRVARKRFYLRNGFFETGRFTVLCKEKYELICSEKELDEGGLMEIISAFHKLKPEFEEVLL